MPFINRYSAYNGQNDYKSYNYVVPQRSWRPPRYVSPVPASTTASVSVTTTVTAIPVSSSQSFQNEQKLMANLDEKLIDPFATDANVALPQTVTDVLQAEVDYNMQEIDCIMICRGKLIEIQCGDLSAKHGLLAKCLTINNLLQVANLNDKCLSSDPAFIPEESKAIIKFHDIKDAEQFINSHNIKYRIILQNTKQIDNNSNILSLKATIPVKIENEIGTATTISSFELNGENKVNGEKSTKTIRFDDVIRTEKRFNDYTDVMTQSFNEQQTTRSFSLTDDSVSSVNKSNGQSAKQNDSFNDDIKFDNNIEKFNENDAKNNDIQIKRNQIEGYETLTIRAKLKQRVGPNRTKHVTLRDIDSIMRNVVTVVQNEFMKQFPSATAITDGQENKI